MSLRSKTGLGLSICLLAMQSCRELSSACSDTLCDRAGTTGQADVPGAAAAAGGAPSGAHRPPAGGVSSDGGPGRPAAGAADDEVCETDADCSDELACNGREQCAFGRCQVGAAPVCAAELHCAEQGVNAFSCDFNEPGQWLTFLGNDSGEPPFQLYAERLVGAAHSPAQSLTDGITSAAFPTVSIDSWSPDGRKLIIANAAEDLNSNRLFAAAFGGGQPSPPVLIPDLPVGGSSTSVAWATDSSSLLVQNSDVHYELYLVQFLAERTSVKLVFENDEALVDVGFCQDARWFHRGRAYSQDAVLTDTLHPSALPVLLWQDAYTSASPDQRWLLGLGLNGRLWVSSCGPEAKPALLSKNSVTRGPQWSFDSRYIAFTSEGSAGEGLQVLDATQRFKQVYAGPEQDFLWFPHNSRLLVSRAAPDDEIVELGELDFAALPPTARSTGSIARSSWGWATDDATWFSTINSKKGEESIWLLDGGRQAPRLIADHLTSPASMFDPAGNCVVLTQPLDDGTQQLLSISLHGSSPAPVPLFSTPLPGNVWIEGFTHDGAGLIVNHSTEQAGQVFRFGVGPSGVSEPVQLSNLRFGAYATLQPMP